MVHIENKLSPKIGIINQYSINSEEIWFSIFLMDFNGAIELSRNMVIYS